MDGLSIIIPTRNESRNIIPLHDRIASALSGMVAFNVFFVDDSTDDTPMKIKSEQNWDRRIGLYHREHFDRNGLAGAVVDGLKRTQSEYVIVMDADLQHPPEILPIIYEQLRAGSDIVIPSRFVPGGSDGGLSGSRKLISWGARQMGRVFVPGLRNVTDPTSGFFGFRRDIIDPSTLNPLGWKILIEVIARGQYRTISEIPYHFAPRFAGDSKMSAGEQWNYIRHLFRLRWSVNHAAH